MIYDKTLGKTVVDLSSVFTGSTVQKVEALTKLLTSMLPLMDASMLNVTVESSRFVDVSDIKRIVIAGSRTCRSTGVLKKALRVCGWKPSVILCGEALGADQLGKRYAVSKGLHVESFPADWKSKGKGAGMIRNLEMLKRADGLIALWDGRSPGTRHIIHSAKALNIPTHVQLFDSDDFLT